jgi:probable addiction module antidote protein
MAVKTLPYDSAEYLEDDQAIAEYLEEAMKIAMEDSDPSFLAVALGTVARARGMSQIAKDAGLSRESLYKALSPAIVARRFSPQPSSNLTQSCETSGCSGRGR